MDMKSMSAAVGNVAAGTPDGGKQAHHYPTRHAGTSSQYSAAISSAITNALKHSKGPGGHAGGSSYARASPTKKDQRHVVFQLIDQEDPRIQARLPMRVMISQHDTTESIITTVKNFYGLYEYGVSFENKDGIGIIAAYDNFDQDMIVYVRTVSQPPSAVASSDEYMRDSTSPRKHVLGAPFEMRPPQSNNANSPSRAAAISSGMRSVSPESATGKRSISAAPGAKSRSHKFKSRENSTYAEAGADGYSSGDNGGGSVTSSRRSRTEQVNAEISVDNIVEGGRRKRAFESSELPLFVPPQVPMSTSISSISPQRRSGPGNMASPYASANQRTFSYQQPLQSPMSYGSGNFAHPGMPAGSLNGQYSRPIRGRPSGSQYRSSNGGILPTPDPTVGSVISDEDVALQLMRLGDASNFSYGRTSNSTADDALSGKAEPASSDEDEGEETEGEERDEDDEAKSKLPAVPRFDDVGPVRKKQRRKELLSDGTSGEEYEDSRDGEFKGDSDDPLMKRFGDRKGGKPKALKPSKIRTTPGAMKPKGKPPHHTRVPVSPSSMPAPSRKGSIASTINFQNQLGTDEEDLSSKPRCQRCRKSKKGCDRQRPCGRCKDAGIGIEGCISEDEGNGRKGRYGRHMGVPVNKAEEVFAVAESNSTHGAAHPANNYFLAPALPDKSKKRKR